MLNIRVVSYNIHKGFSFGNAVFTLPRLAEALDALDADFVFLQEAVGKSRKRRHMRSLYPLTSQVEYLAGNTFPHFAYGKNVTHGRGHHGNALLSRYQIRHWRNINISTNWLERRGVLHCVAEVGGCDVHLLNSHLSLLERSRRSQIDMLIRHMQKEIPPDVPVIVAGDFNDWTGSIGKMLETGLGVRDAFFTKHGDPARTFPAMFPLLALDRVCFSGMECLSACALNGFPWLLFSDHLPIVADFAIRR